MPNEGVLEVTLLDVSGQPAEDDDVVLSVRRASDGQEIRRFQTTFPPVRGFALPAFPDENVLIPTIIPSRYRSKPLPLFTLTHGKTITRNVTTFRLPSEWEAQFTAWDDLSDRFDPLKDVLDASPNLRVRGGAVFDDFTGDEYDDVDPSDTKTTAAKVCLLNLFGKLTELVDPVHGRKRWFGFVDEILEIGRERLIAIVDETMAARVREIRDRLSEFEDYKHAAAGHHHGNMPSRFGVPKSQMFSVKTTENHGNVQLTLGPGTDPDDGSTVWILDVDIDENGDLLAHLGDLIRHKFAGGTHPFDIHEYLLLAHPQIDLGYQLI